MQNDERICKMMKVIEEQKVIKCAKVYLNVFLYCPSQGLQRMRK